MSKIDKTNSIRGTLFRAILKGDFAPGDKLPPEREMADAAGISRVTVRRAYEQLEASGILHREQGRGTFVRDHAEGNPRPCEAVGLLTSVETHFSLEFIRAVEKSLSERDLLLVLRLNEDTPEQEEQAAIDLVGKGISNLIIWPAGQAFPEKTYLRLRVLGANMVFFDRMMPGDYADYVGLDNADAMDQLFAHADHAGLKQPVFVTHRDLTLDSDAMRLEAFQLNCRKRGLAGSVLRLPWRESLTAPPAEIARGSTVFCVNDAMADKLKPLLDGHALYSVDGFSVDAVSCRQPMQEMAEAAVSMLERQQQKGRRWKATRKFCRGELINV
jgi:DNA-binding LacI/PurR family transcriptional regulator